MSKPPTTAKLTADEQLTLDKLRDIRSALERGEHVQNRRLTRWLGEHAVKQMEQRWQMEKDSRPKPKDKPHAIVEYERRLKRANMAYAKAEGASSRGKKNAHELYDKLDVEYERTLEYIQEQVDVDPSLQLWLDRPAIVDFGDTGTGIDFESMPRVVTSRSMENRSDGSLTGQWLTKRDVKIEAVDQAISALANKQTPEQEAKQAAKLKDLLKSMKSK